MARKIPALVRPALLAAILFGIAGQSIAQEYFYAVEVNGMVCGYARIVTSPVSEGGRTWTRLTHELVVRGTLLGAPVDNRVTLTYRIDPATNGGGAFGQHAWNEVYMGKAGWIPIDTTASEVDYVDSGHVRVGVVRSISSALKLLRAEILDHRVGGI